MNKLKKDLVDFKIPIIITTIYCVLSELIFGKMCPFKIIFKKDCPGCGLTRATIALLKGNIRESLHYNYSCIFWLLAFFTFFFDRYVKKLKINPFPVFFIIACLVTLIRYILIVVFNEPIF